MGAIVLIIACVLLYFNMNVNQRLSKTYGIKPTFLSMPADTTGLQERGRYLAGVLCTECHAPDLGGKIFFSDPQLGTIISANLTPGKGGVGSTYKTEDWVRSIRHGVNPAGRPLLIMPAKDFHHLGERDLAAVVSYLKSLQPIDRSFPAGHMTLMAKIILATGGFGDAISAEVIDHKAGFAASPKAAVTAEYGRYLIDASGCRTCHGQDLNGAKDPNPQAPPAPNLTPAGHLANWSAEQFIQTMRSGTTPEGKSMVPAFMPWMSIGKMTDEDLKAAYTYLKTLPSKPDGYKP